MMKAVRHRITLHTSRIGAMDDILHRNWYHWLIMPIWLLCLNKSEIDWVEYTNNYDSCRFIGFLWSLSSIPFKNRLKLHILNMCIGRYRSEIDIGTCARVGPCTLLWLQHANWVRDALRTHMSPAHIGININF